MKKKLSIKGFTLIELLVVITIIAILSVIGLAIFSDTQKKARDARRRSDIQAIANVLETNYNGSTGQYPASLNCLKFVTGTCPNDPINSGDYVYNNVVAATGFTTCAKLEAGGGNSDNNTFGVAGTSHYCRKNLQ